jgi:hypothetical protein
MNNLLHRYPIKYRQHMTHMKCMLEQHVIITLTGESSIEQREMNGETPIFRSVSIK